MSLTSKQNHHDALPQTAKSVLVMGRNSLAISSALQKLDSGRLVCHAETANQVLELTKKHEFSHVLIDNRDDGPIALLVPRLAALKLFSIIVLAGPANSEQLHAVPGDITVLDAPYHPKAMSIALGYEPERRSKDRPFARKPVQQKAELPTNETLADNTPVETNEVVAPAVVAPAAVEADQTVAPKQPQVEAKKSTNPAPSGNLMPPAPANSQGSTQNIKSDRAVDSANAVARFFRTLFNLVPGLTPIISTIYKHLALTILAGLLVAFVTYALMIVYFLVDNNWSTPLELTEGHALVEKARRDHTDMEVRKNYLRQQVSQFNRNLGEAQEFKQQAETLKTFVLGTISSEIEMRKDQLGEINTVMEDLNDVLKQYGSRDERRKEVDRRADYFKRRLITRDSFDNARINWLNVERNVTTIMGELTDKRLEQNRITNSISYLQRLEVSLKEDKPLEGRANGADLVPVNNQIIEITQLRTKAASIIAGINKERDPLLTSLNELEHSMSKLEASPLYRALSKPLTVLFVPYENMSEYKPGKPLYACTFKVIWCSKIGEVKDRIPGEIDIEHPFFGKPLRGQFFEADLSTPDAAHNTIVHVGSPPLFF